MRTCVRRVIIMRLSVRVRRCSNAVFIAISRCNVMCHNRAGGAPCNCCTGSSRLLKQLLLLSHLLRHCPAAVSCVRAAPLELNSEHTTAICTRTHVRANAQDSRHNTRTHTHSLRARCACGVLSPLIPALPEEPVGHAPDHRLLARLEHRPHPAAQLVWADVGDSFQRECGQVPAQIWRARLPARPERPTERRPRRCKCGQSSPLR